MSPLQSVDKNIPILVVDNLSTMRRLLVHSLAKIGYTTISEATDTITALDLLERNDFKLIIADWSLPQDLPDSFFSILPEHPDLKHIPLLIIATENQRRMIPQSMLDRGCGLIMKPFTPSLLEERIAALMSPKDPRTTPERSSSAPGQTVNIRTR